MGKFKHLVDSEEGMKSFRTKYKIPPNVGVRYVAQGEWFDKRKTGEVVIPMIAFIERGMTIPIGTLTRNFKSRHPEIRLIQYLPISNKGLKDDFLIFSEQWHDSLFCLVKEETSGGGSTANFYVFTYATLLFPLVLCFY